MINCNSCSDFFSVGCHAHCDEIVTGMTTTVAGVYTIVARWLGAIHELELTLGASAPLNIPSGFFNEDGETYFTITDPNGADFTHTTFTCFKVEIKVTF